MSAICIGTCMVCTCPHRKKKPVTEGMIDNGRGGALNKKEAAYKKCKARVRNIMNLHFLLSSTKNRWILTSSKDRTREEAFRSFFTWRAGELAIFFASLRALALTYKWKKVEGMETLIKLITVKLVRIFQAQ